MLVQSSNSSIFLVGYRGSGKSRVGAIVAEQLGVPFFDTDQLVERQTGMTIAAIFQAKGEAAFRDLESQVVTQVTTHASSKRLVVAVGGGVVLRQENVVRLRDAGLIVWLRARAETLEARIVADSASATMRPVLVGCSVEAEVQSVLNTRQKW